VKDRPSAFVECIRLFSVRSCGLRDQITADFVKFEGQIPEFNSASWLVYFPASLRRHPTAKLNRLINALQKVESRKRPSFAKLQQNVANELQFLKFYKKCLYSVNLLLASCAPLSRTDPSDASGLQVGRDEQVRFRQHRPEERSHLTVSPGRRNTLVCEPIAILWYCTFICYSLIRILLAIGNVEINPGPTAQEPLNRFSFTTLNCRGLTDNVKMLKSIAKLKKYADKIKGTSIFLLQETHDVNEFLLEGCWRGKIVNAKGSRAQRGVITLIPDNIPIERSLVDPNGRYAITEISINSVAVVITNIYAPNDHSESLVFFTNLFETLRTFSSGISAESSEYLFAGDFNFVFDHLDDASNRTFSRKEKSLGDMVANELLNLELFDLVQLSKQIHNYTWGRQDKRSRIDYMFASSGLAYQAFSYETIWKLVNTDHAAISVIFGADNKHSRGRSYPKLSENDLSCDSDKLHVREQILEALKTSNEWDPHMRLEYIKMTIRSVVLEIRKRKRSESLELDNMKCRLNSLLNDSPASAETREEIDKLNVDIYKLEEEMDHKLMTMAGVKWREEGERSSKFFLNQMKSRIQQTASPSFVDGQRVITSRDDIMEHGKSFYSTLYKAPPHATPEDQVFFSQCPKLGDRDVSLLELPITVRELEATLKGCRDSCPGLDGIPYSFYRIFGDLLLPIVLESWQYGLSVGVLAPSHTRSCITIIPKAGKDGRFIKNWRPITVSACDIKIITKCLALRMSKTLNSIICDAQAAYIPGRDINFNNRILRLITQSSLIDSWILSFDAEKAFDSIRHEYIRKTLGLYGYPASFIKAFDLLYCNIDATLQINGWLSSPFKIERGVKQGCALSCCLFVLCMDPLLRNIQANPRIEGIKLNNGEGKTVKILAYADDVAAVVKGSSSIKETFYEYERLYKQSGLKLNGNKTECLSLCADSFPTGPFEYLGESVNLGMVTKVKVCGNVLSLCQETSYADNVTPKIRQIESILNLWRTRHLSINGKMIILKTFALSQLVFVSQFMVIKNADIKKVEALCYKFLWDGKVDRIKRAYLKNSKEMGGINGIDLDCFFRAIQTRQFLKADKTSSLLQSIQNNPECREEISIIARESIFKLYKYYYSILDETVILSTEDRTRIANYDLRGFTKHGSKCDVTLKQLNINCIAAFNDAVIPRGKRNIIYRSLPISVRSELFDEYEYRPVFYGLFANNKHILLHSCSSKLLQLLLKTALNKVEPIQGNTTKWNGIWKVGNPTLRSILYKVAHKDVFCNSRRYRCNLVDNDRCIICNEREDIEHQLISCPNARRLWITVKKVFNIQIQTLDHLLSMDRPKTELLIVAVILKALIQIDRSKDVTSSSVMSRIKSFLVIEDLVKKNANNSRALTLLTQAKY